ncbi:MAG: anthranilate phosphoribosyltransferase [Candidatus Zixiibacteriota bacterium]
MLRPFIKVAMAGSDLCESDAETAMGLVMSGEASPAQIAAWLVALRLKGETTEEIVGFVHAMRSSMVVLNDVPVGAIDTCGTGGDGLGTFNVSTVAGLIAAACGVPVAKHGNRAVSSRSGSADVLAALGFEIDPGPAVVQNALGTCRFAFLFAPRFHPAMRHALAPRREIGVRTVFNLLGPLCNPAGVRRQVVGVYDPKRLRQMAEVLAHLGAERALVVCGPHDADELLPCGDNRVAEWDGQSVREYTIHPSDWGMGTRSLDDLTGGDATENAGIIRAIAGGVPGPHTDAAIMNAGAALYIAGTAPSIAEGIRQSRSAVSEGRLATLLTSAVAASREDGTGREATP